MRLMDFPGTYYNIDGTATVHKLPEKTFVILFLLAGGPGVEEQSKYYIGTYYLLDSHTYLKL